MVQPANDLTAGSLGGKVQPIRTQTATAISAAVAARFQNVGTMQTYLQTQGYTAAQVSAMSKNDLTYATKLKSGI
jgi:hypothetical protein